jgi:protoheme IX farnesyltransferase
MLIFFGSSTLLFTASLAAPLLGLFAVFWYNGIYTPLKKRTAFAVIPGALVGAVPPAIGWVAGGGDWGDPKLLALCFFFFIWQVPHFWLLILNYAEDYEKAGLPSLTGIFSKTQLVRITFSWVLATAVSCLFMTVHRMIRFPFVNFLLLAVSFWLIGNGISLLRERVGDSFYSFAFKRINIYLFLVMVLLSADRLFMQVTQ